MSETLPATQPSNEQAAHQQLDLTAEPGWNDQMSPEAYHKLEFDVEQPATDVPDFPLETTPATAEAATPAPVAETSYVNPPASPEDLQRIEKEAKEYFKYFEGPQPVAETRRQVAAQEQAVKAAMIKQFQELGIADINNERVMEGIVIQKVAEGMAAAKAKKILELTAATFPYKEGQKPKETDKARESFARMLSMPDDEFGQLQQDWETHNINQLHGQALEEDKAYKNPEQKRLAQAEIARLNEKYDGVLPEISRLPLDRETGGATQVAVDAYLERQQKIESSSDSLVDPALIAEASRAQALRDLETQLKQKYQSEGLSDDQIQSRLDESRGVLDTWLANIKQPGALDELKSFELQQNKEQMLQAKRQKVREYLGSTLVPRLLRRSVGMESRGQTPTIDNLKEVIAQGVDHNGSHVAAGGEAMLHSENAGNLWSRVMSNLELARNLSRNEGRLMTGLIYLTLLEKGLEGGAAEAWAAIPEKTKQEARKKLMLGMSVTARAVVRMSVQAAAKARKTAATGAAAGTMWASANRPIGVATDGSRPAGRAGIYG